MAGAKSGVHVVQLKPISVPKSLVDGNKFVKWDDDAAVGTPVTLKVDNKGFFLHWTDQNKETEFVEISCIRDVRTGRYARVPKEGKLRDSVTMGPQDIPLEDKTITVVHGFDLVNVNFINFCCIGRDIAQEWTDTLMEMAYNLLALNAPATTFLEKLYTKIQFMTDKEGKVPVKNVVKLFAQNKDDKKRVEKALELCGISTGKNDTICPEKFTLENFLSFYRYLTGREEVDAIFESLTGSKKKGMTVDQLVEFLNKEQRDPRLNEILYPYADPARVREIIKQYEPHKSYAQKGLLSVDGFLRYLLSADNVIVAPEKFDLNNDMDQPLSHYFINSSHNTYLTGHQLTGKSSVEIYRQCLLTGCRCVELDCWNGKNSDEEPIITHGYTVVTEVLLKEVLEAIAESAFKTSDYPVLLSFENHCSPKQQAKMAMYCTKILGDLLLSEPLPNFELKPEEPLPSPNHLRRKILIKNKKKHYPKKAASSKSSGLSEKEEEPALQPSTTPEKVRPVSSAPEGEKIVPTKETVITNGVPEMEKVPSEMDDSSSDSGSEEEEQAEAEQQVEDQNEGTAAKESEAGAEMSALVLYTQPVRFHTFEHAEKRNRCYEISSFVETQATNLLKEHPVEFVNYNKKQLSRIYPKGTRVDSSNYMPQVFWNAGCQLVALNFQTLDLGMQLNLGIFEYNGRSGYLVKPNFMRRKDRKFDPFTESTVDGIIAGTVSIRIISGQLLTDKRVGTYVEVDMYGLPADTVRRKFRTKTVPNNGINPIYDEEPFVFKKVVLPDLACLRIAVYDDNGRFIGHRVLPVVGLRPGYRHISLRNESGQPLQFHTLFVQITVKDYIPDGFSELADALANPIAYQSIMEKHACQLMALTDDDDNIDDVKGSGKSPAKVSIGSIDNTQSTRKEDQTDSKGSQPSSRHNTINGNIQRMTSSGSTSPAAMPALKRQETLRRGLAQSVRSLSDENAQEKIPSLLESEEANLAAETLDKIREQKPVQKVIAKLEKDLLVLRKKHEKLREKEKEQLLLKEEKLMKAQEHQKTHIVKSHSKLAKKSSGIDVQLLKRKSEAGLQAMSVEHQTKLDELQKLHSHTLISLTKELYKAELELHQKYQESIYTAMEKSLMLSQTAQMDHLKSLHDREVAELMKRLEVQNKEEMKELSKKHKDKNELARIKRESHQKLIEQAVAERQRFSSLLDKRKNELERQHIEIRKQLEDEKNSAHERLQQDFQDKVSRLLIHTEECSSDSSPAIEPIERTTL
ncbi:1-phosphatidylinositol 4,5-bisphosphate phosphodiesterase classes I and II isoform X2 [Parasteatoda tepidariorum]|uniref:1-phosphatidylinositol 4,5-bisphosphate phosphodiesterase classes I and II isoform X2 n=1 Tax=Parasteatoda tepidariorum TaxID=114398 RepID=UPI00077FD3A1|nr:1-phosphatidylinositol 4,5-bisphosphate phosphodiesterase classes I and II [Parasteatoda tepidariorum]